MLSVNDQIKVTKIGLCGEDLFVLSQMYQHSLTSSLNRLGP